MRKSFRDPEHLEFTGVAAGFQVKASPFAEVRRVATDVDGDVPDMAGEHTDELALRFSELVVQAAQNTSCRKRLVVLNESCRQTGVREVGLVEYFSEPTATIPESPGFNQLYVAKRCVNELHRNSLSRGRAIPSSIFGFRVFSGFCSDSGQGQRWLGTYRG